MGEVDGNLSIYDLGRKEFSSGLIWQVLIEKQVTARPRLSYYTFIYFLSFSIASHDNGLSCVSICPVLSHAIIIVVLSLKQTIVESFE